ncbi:MULTISPECIES: hypothetical protein [Streptomyces]|uniref:hypothetical protein n=1 Tax=Streptomyces TaxID=1883 RepID=UPI00343B0FD5
MIARRPADRVEHIKFEELMMTGNGVNGNSRRATLVARGRNGFVVCALASAVAVGAVAWLGQAAGAPARGNVEAAALVAESAPGSIVEDFEYPGAEKILAERGIVLKRGDGNITLVDCASGTGFIEVWARRQGGEKICFRVTGDSGFLKLEIPAVHSIKGNEYTTGVDMTVGEETKSFDIIKNVWTSVGESADEQGREHILVEIRTSK